MNIVSVRKQPEYAKVAVKYFQDKWASEGSMVVYEDCIMNCITAESSMPEWYLLFDDDEIIGCAGLITNDFISRMDLYPWICALYIEETYRGYEYGRLLLEYVKNDAREAGFKNVYLCTDHVGYYEHYDFKYLAQGYHPWGEESRIYVAKLSK